MDKFRKMCYYSHMNETIYIYVLIDPRNGEYRYIGSTNDPDKRKSYHAAQGGRLRLIHRYGIRNICYRDVWLSDLRESGFKPTMKLLEQCTQSVRTKREKFWIDFFTKRGCVLVNKNLTGRKRGTERHARPPAPIWLESVCYNLDIIGLWCMDNI